ncbi:tRNA (adenosine(37)-N6)-threonylcarbamoyltransferase complex ATPase subunit type 1 TsaE [Bacillaceae bacterium S4-13-58]
MNFKMITYSEEETKQFAEKVAILLKPGDLITLEGDLGAGKTTFTKGLAKGLSITKTVNSPTFTIVKEYMSGRIPLYHMDAYRLENSDEDIGFDEYFNGDGVCVVEWASYIPSFLPKEYLTIFIRKLEDDQREIVFEPKGDRYKDLCEEIFS